MDISGFDASNGSFYLLDAAADKVQPQADADLCTSPLIAHQVADEVDQPMMSADGQDGEVIPAEAEIGHANIGEAFPEAEVEIAPAAPSVAEEVAKAVAEVKEGFGLPTHNRKLIIAVLVALVLVAWLHRDYIRRVLNI